MTIEADLKTIATAVTNIQNLLEELVAVKATQSAPAPAVEPTPAPTAPAPRVEAPVPAAPPVPDFMQTPAPAAPAVPFTNAKELTDYCKNKYLALGPVRGGAIQSILTSMGIANVATIPVERYAEFFQKVEAL